MCHVILCYAPCCFSPDLPSSLDPPTSPSEELLWGGPQRLLRHQCLGCRSSGDMPHRPESPRVESVSSVDSSTLRERERERGRGQRDRERERERGEGERERDTDKGLRDVVKGEETGRHRPISKGRLLLDRTPRPNLRMLDQGSIS